MVLGMLRRCVCSYLLVHWRAQSGGQARQAWLGLEGARSAPLARQRGGSNGERRQHRTCTCMNQPVLSPSHQYNVRKIPIKQWLRMTACAFTSAATELLHRVLSTSQQIPSSMMRLWRISLTGVLCGVFEDHDACLLCLLQPHGSGHGPVLPPALHCKGSKQRGPAQELVHFQESQMAPEIAVGCWAAIHLHHM